MSFSSRVAPIIEIKGGRKKRKRKEGRRGEGGRKKINKKEGQIDEWKNEEKEERNSC